MANQDHALAASNPLTKPNSQLRDNHTKTVGKDVKGDGTYCSELK